MASTTVVLLLLFCVGSCYGGETHLIQGFFNQAFGLSNGESFMVQFMNEPLESITYLSSYRTVHLETYESVTYTVFLGTVESDLNAVLRDPSVLNSFPNVHAVSCHSLLPLKSDIESCDFTLSYYGEPDYGWIPRFHYLFTTPPNTLVAIHLSGNQYSERVVFNIHVDTVDSKFQSLILILLGISLYFSADLLSSSLVVYLTFWILMGVFISIVGIAAFVLFYCSRAATKGGIGLTNLLLITAASWVSLYYVDVIPTTGRDILQNKFWMGSMMVGGMLGMWFGYTTRLSPIQQGRMSLGMKIVSLAMVFWSVHQVELALVLCFLLVSNIPSVLYHYYYGWKDPITVEQEELQIYREEPHLLTYMSPSARRKYLGKLADPHLDAIFDQDYEDFISDDDWDDSEDSD